MSARLSLFMLVFAFCFSGWVHGFLAKKEVKIGKAVPDFELSDSAGKTVKLSGFRGSLVMIYFWSARCPYVKRYEERIQKIVSDYQDRGVRVIGIDSNENETLEDIQSVISERRISYPVLLDDDNKIADQLGAITTPHVFIIDRDGILRYEGAPDDQGWSESKVPEKHSAREALDALLSGSPVEVTETKTFGCTIKRKF